MSAQQFISARSRPALPFREPCTKGIEMVTLDFCLVEGELTRSRVGSNELSSYAKHLAVACNPGIPSISSGLIPRRLRRSLHLALF